MASYYRRLKELLEANGWWFHRMGKGSHEIWTNASGQKLPLPFNCNVRHTANGILRDAGIDERV